MNYIPILLYSVDIYDDDDLDEFYAKSSLYRFTTLFCHILYLDQKLFILQFGEF